MSKEEYNLKYTKNIKAFIQILPIEEKCWKYVKVSEDHKELYLRYVHDFARGAHVKEPNFWKFYTDGVLSDCRPNEINTLVVDDEALERACAGVSLLVFAYGQTGSGKSNTMNGLFNVYENRGLIPRVIPRLFEMKRRLRNEYHVDFRVSYIEIHRRYVLDLLKEKSRVHHTLCDLSIRRARSEQEMLIALFAGESQKRICKFRNYVSHYYTTVFTINVYSRTMKQSDTCNHLAKIHFIDMAGADTKGNPSCSWKTNDEIGTANLNKSQLEHCLLLLQENIDNEKIIKGGGIFVDLIGKELKPESNIRKYHVGGTRGKLVIPDRLV